MKTKINSLLVIAAGFALSAAGAYGQDRVVANIPFAFQAGGKAQAAGQYAVARQGEATVLQNVETRKSIVAGLGIPEGPDRNQPPALVFTCGGESGCALTQVRMADGRTWKFKAPSLKPYEAARVEVVRLDGQNAE
jgi:hypothetical protein